MMKWAVFLQYGVKKNKLRVYDSRKKLSVKLKVNGYAAVNQATIPLFRVNLRK